MNILVLSQHFAPENFRINEVAEALVGEGEAVTVLTGQPNYPEGAIFENYNVWSCSVQDQPEGYCLARVPLIPRGRGSAFQLIVNYLSFILSASIIGPILLRRRKIDVVFVYATSPVLQAIAGIVFKRLKRAALVIWVQDLWPESLEATGFVRAFWALKLVERLVAGIYGRADLLLVQSNAFIAPVSRLAGNVPVVYHPNPGPAMLAERAAPANEVRLPAGFNIAFAGNLGTVQALDTIVGAAEILRDDNVRFVIVGSGSRGDWLAREVERRELQNVLLLGRFPPYCMPGIFAQSSALLVTLARNPVLARTIPSKLQTYFAAGKPLIASLDGEGAEIVNQAGAGLSCPAEDPKALADAVRVLLSMLPEERNAMGAAAIDYHVRHFEPKGLAAKLVRHFALLCRNEHAQAHS